MHQSENQGELRNDGRSVHHRMVLAVRIVVLESKLLELKKLAGITSTELQSQPHSRQCSHQPE